MVKVTQKHPIELCDQVTSPAGTTSRALELLAERGFYGTVTQAVRAAAARSRELGE
jgi:pyrroline-5-carboxylate reductase